MSRSSYCRWDSISFPDTQHPFPFFLLQRYDLDSLKQLRYWGNKSAATWPSWVLVSELFFLARMSMKVMRLLSLMLRKALVNWCERSIKGLVFHWKQPFLRSFWMEMRLSPDMHVIFQVFVSNCIDWHIVIGLWDVWSCISWENRLLHS